MTESAPLSNNHGMTTIAVMLTKSLAEVKAQLSA